MPSPLPPRWWKDAGAAISSVITRKRVSLLLAWFVSASITPVAYATSPLQYTTAHAYEGKAPRWQFRVVKRVEQDRALFTQGLQFHNDHLWLSSGLYGQSRVLAFTCNQDNNCNTVGHQFALLPQLFGEGLAVANDEVYVLTWHEQQLLRFKESDLSPLPPLRYKGEGWGLAFDGKQLIRSDGSDSLYFHDRETFRVTRRLAVHDGSQNIHRLNELEWVHGLLLANIWITNTIIVIDPSDGSVKAHLDLKGLLPEKDIQEDTDVLNGIAWDEANKLLWVTGKRWPARFALDVDELKQLTDNR